MKFVLRLCCFLVALPLFTGGCSSEKSADKLREQGQKAFLASRFPEARQRFQDVLKQLPSDRVSLYFLGLSYKRDMMYDSAIIYFKRVDILYPRDREINMELAETSLLINNWDYAERAMENLVSMGEPLDQFINQLVAIQVKQNDPQGAVYYLRRQAANRSDDTTYYVQLATALAELDSTDAADIVLDTAIQKFGPSRELTMTRGVVHAYAGRLDKAETIVRNLKASDTVSTHQLEYKLRLAQILAAQQNVAKKREALSLFHEIRPQIRNNPEVDSLIADLESQLQQP